MRRALFLDRDGIINIDHGYVHRPEQVEFVPGIFALARLAVARDLLLVVATNQSGIGRGLYDEADFHRLMRWMGDEFARQGAPLHAVEFCPDHPGHGLGPYRRDSARRKPGPGMLLDAAAAHGIALGASLMLGDKASDMQAALAAGIGTRILATVDAAEAARAPAGTLVLPSVAAVAGWLAATGGELSPSRG
ncbi:D-glycero-alpha-D-manno-heptose-1,7-bisphosphate 7-phosphatase [Belnapia rosea]|uniref:D-glycero-alpha-D-manno-heptose-1,7-bisphosphate 7-phosphatase n=1 Tax=Belnapia rosea TaxID=938405 RepID=UPI0008800F1D|nr:HAD family hydrolase [Belnapia rosea]SDB29603.1 D-glycero-D-manno-heptose 1,7-bisphosphate phosphatase [Belnapia rosea]